MSGTSPTATAAELVEVRILRMPLDIYDDAAQHTEELRREFALIAQGEPGGIPQRLNDLIQTLRQEFDSFGVTARAAVEEARAAGRSEIDLVYQVPAVVAPAARRLQDHLEEADDYCRSGDLLTLATPEKVRRFRNWFLDEFQRQVAGEAPRSWPEAATG